MQSYSFTRYFDLATDHAKQDQNGANSSSLQYSLDGLSFEGMAGGSSSAAMDFSPLTYRWSANAATSGAGPTTNGGGTIVSTPGSGLVFDNTYSSGDTAAYEACIVAAEKQLEGLFTNSVTLNITFNEADQGNTGGALGNSWNSWTTVSFAQLKAALPSSDVMPSSDPTGGLGFHIPEAYARMLGLSSSKPGTDDTVTLNTFYNWSYGQDIINGVTHELSEGGMGRVGGLGDQNGVWSTMDLFRYTSTGKYDTTDGRDGQTTYFSSNGGLTTSQKGVPSLSFNNEFNSSDQQVNGGDTADWTQESVFGSVGTGETLTMNQTELDVMQALGWKLNLQQQFFTASSGSWETPTNWNNGYAPITVEDAAIGVLSAAAATLDSDVTVNSIATNTESSLVIGGDSTLIATNGTVLNSADSSTLYSGNLGVIIVDTGSALDIGNTFDNAGTLAIGKGAGGAGNLGLAGTVTLNGGGTLQLGEVGSTDTSGDIVVASSSGGGLVNVNNTITGGGVINLTSFDNQASGKVEASQAGIGGNALQIIASTFTNEGLMFAEQRSTLNFGQDGGTGSLANTGEVELDSQGDLALSGNFTISGSGAVAMKGAGAWITSDGAAPATLTNASTIADLSTGQIGDIGFFGSDANDLTFVNTGEVYVSGVDDTLAINTGANVVQDGGGTILAETNGQLTIDSNVETGVVKTASAVGGTIEAESGGRVIITGSVTNGIPTSQTSLAGEVLIQGGTVDLGSAASVAVPVVFNGAGGTLEVNSATTPISSIAGLEAGDSFLLTGTAIDSVGIHASWIVADTNNTNYTFNHVAYDGSVTGFVAWEDFPSGMERITFTGSAALSLSAVNQTFYQGDATFNLAGDDDTVHLLGSGDVLNLSNADVPNEDRVLGSNATIGLNGAIASIAGVNNTINMVGTGNEADISGTGANQDTVNGSNATVSFFSAEGSVVGGSDLINLTGTGDQVSLLGTGSNFDTVNGSHATLFLSDAFAQLSGGADTIDFQGGSGDTLYASDTAGAYDLINGSSGVVHLTSAQATIKGSGDTIAFAGGSGNVASISGTTAGTDTITGNGGTLKLSTATAKVTGSGDTLDFAGTDNVVATAGGTSELFAFAQGIGGVDRIGGYASTDKFQFSKNDFANFAALSAHMTQSGANTVISLSASDAVALLGVTASTLHSSQFTFV